VYSELLPAKCFSGLQRLPCLNTFDVSHKRCVRRGKDLPKYSMVAASTLRRHRLVLPNASTERSQQEVQSAPTMRQGQQRSYTHQGKKATRAFCQRPVYPLCSNPDSTPCGVKENNGRDSRMRARTYDRVPVLRKHSSQPAALNERIGNHEVAVA